MKIKEGRVKFVKPKRMLQIISNFEKLVFYVVSLQRVWCYDKVKSLVCIRSMSLLQGKHVIKSVPEWCNRILVKDIYRNSIAQWLFLENLRLIGNWNRLHSHELMYYLVCSEPVSIDWSVTLSRKSVSDIISLKVGACEVLIEYLKSSLCW